MKSAFQSRQLNHRKGLLKHKLRRSPYDDEIPIPNKGDVIQRNGTSWKVIQVNVTQGVSAPKPVDVYRIFLHQKPIDELKSLAKSSNEFGTTEKE